jgi:hypothetical protein
MGEAIQTAMEIPMAIANDAFVGSTIMTVSKETMNLIVSRWLHENVSGGPYKINDVTDSENFDDSFDIDFEPVTIEAKPAN